MKDRNRSVLSPDRSKRKIRALKACYVFAYCSMWATYLLAIQAITEGKSIGMIAMLLIGSIAIMVASWCFDNLMEDEKRMLAILESRQYQ